MAKKKQTPGSNPKNARAKSADNKKAKNQASIESAKSIKKPPAAELLRTEYPEWAEACSPVLSAMGDLGQNPLRAISYSIYVINISKWIIIGYSIGGRDQRARSPIPQTCTLSSWEECARRGNYKLLLDVPFSTSPFDLYLIGQLDGRTGISDPVRITPDPGNPQYFIRADFR